MLKILPLLALVAVPTAVGGAVEGIVLTSTGQPVEHARVGIATRQATVFTGMEGTFRFEDWDPPCEVIVTHPRFEVHRVSVGRDSDQPVEIVLVPKQEIYEEIAVSANREEDAFAPSSVAATVVSPGDIPVPPTTVGQLVAEIPAVSENGQGGMFQTWSIRGVSRQRVMTLVSGMRIVSERRAGASASFIDPQLLGSVDVVRGPSSTYYGSGALGGVVQLFPRRFEGLTFEGGLTSQGTENFQLVGWGNESLSVGVTRRGADNAETPAGELLYSGFEQVSGTAAGWWTSGSLRYELQAIGSVGDDIGKANTDHPERTTTYPAEEHLLLRLAVRSERNWSLEAWTHPNSLETEVVSGTRANRVDNEAIDFGFNWQREIRLPSTISSRLGVDYFGRRGVEAVENIIDTSSGTSEQQASLQDGEEDEAGLYGAVEWNLGPAVLLAGGRLAWQRQVNADQPSIDDSAISGFAGLVLPLGKGFEVAANLGSGLRFPSLSERFFTGTTGRGEVIANQNLDPERSLNVDAGLRWYGERLFVSGYLFRNAIDDYIERIEIEPDVLTFVNLTSGTIEGLEVEGLFQWNSNWGFTFGGHALAGRDDGGRPLADVPADGLFGGVVWSEGRWRARGRWEHRLAKNDPGSGEKPVPSVDLVSTSLECRITDAFMLSLTGRNLLDEEYYNAADDKVPLSPGRSVGLYVRWQQP